MRALRFRGTWPPTLFHSIRFRLTLWFVLILAVVLSIFSTLIYFVQARDLQVAEIGRIEEKFARVTAFFHSPGWQNSNLSSTDLPGGAAPLQPGDLLMLTDTNGHIAQAWG